MSIKIHVCVNRIAILALTTILTGVMASPLLQAQKTKKAWIEKLPEVTTPPDSLHLDKFYKKYLNANGITITSSWRVPDSALIQAWRIVSFMTGDLPEKVLDAMVRVKTRVTVMARYEGTTDVPEHSYLAADTSLNWDVRARGLGGDIEFPLTSWAEGVQNWFKVNAEVPKPDGKHNQLNTRKELKKYDPDLYRLIGQYFSKFRVSPSNHLA